MATYSNTAREVEMPNGDVVVIHNAPTGGENTTSNIKKFKYDDNGHVTESTAADAEDLNLSSYSTPTTGTTAIGASDDVQTAIGKLDHQSHIDQSNILYRIKTIKIGSDSTEYNPDTETGIATIPAYPTTLPASDVSAWAKAANKPTYTASEVGAIATTAKGANSGVAELDANGKVPSSQLPSYVDDVLEYSAKSSFPATGETGKIYVDTSTNLTYRWSGTAYVEISPSLALGTTSSTAYYGDKGKTAYDHATETKLGTTASGLYKVASTAQGHIASLTAVTKSDITGLGIPASDTNTYVSGASFADNTSSDANNPLKLTLARSGSVTTSVTGNLPKVSSSTAGVVPKGATVSSQSQTTKFLREDGSWAAPSYTTNTNTTYTLATGNSNGQIKVTPSSGSAYNVSVKGLGSAAYASNATGINLSNYSTPAEGTSTTIGASDAIQTAVGKLDRQNSDLTGLQAEDRAELIELVDSGAKNLLDFANLQFQAQGGTTYTKTDTDITVTSSSAWAACTYKMSLSAGNYVFSAKISNLSVGSGGSAKICLDTASDGHGTRAATLDIAQNGTVSKAFTWGGGTLYIMYYPNYTATAITTTFKASENMICTKAAFGVSQKFVPYKGNFITVPLRKSVRYNCTSTDYERITALDFVVPSDTYVKVTATLKFSNGAPRGIKIIDAAISNPANAIVAINESTENYGAITASCLLFNAGTVKTYAVYTKSASVSGNDVIITIEYLN